MKVELSDKELHIIIGSLKDYKKMIRDHVYMGDSSVREVVDTLDTEVTKIISKLRYYVDD